MVILLHFPSFLIDCFWDPFQKYLRNLAECTRSFGVVLDLNNLDISVVQESVTMGTEYPALHKYLADAVAYMCEMMSDHQRDWLGFDRWYQEIMEYAMFGTPKRPIVIDN